jgi:ParB family chromosome partitioning protein
MTTTRTTTQNTATSGAQAQQSEQFQVGTTVHVAPDTLLMTKNIREATPSTDLIKSVADLGVLQPIVAVLTEDSTGLLVRYGHRRTLAAIEAKRETVPVYIGGIDGQEATTEIRRVIGQRDENTQRDGLTAADDLHVVETLIDLGLSAAQVAKQARIKRADVDAAVAVSGSKLASKAAERYDLDLAQLAVLAEFEDDTETVKALVVAAREGKFEHVAQRARDDRDKAQAREALTASLAEAGLRIIDRPNYDTKAKRLSSLKADTDATEVLTVETHAECPGHVVWIDLDWIDLDKNGNPLTFPDEPEDTGDEEADEAAWEAHEQACERIRATSRRVQRPVAEYGCDNPSKHGHVDRYSYGSPTTKPKAADMSDEEREKAKKARALVIENNKAWEASQPVRREWLREFATRKTPPKGTGAFLATALCQDAAEVNDLGGNALAADWLKAKSNGGYGRTDLSPTKTATENRALVIALVQVLGGYEASITKDTWRHDGTTNATGRFLRFLQACGYRSATSRSTRSASRKSDPCGTRPQAAGSRPTGASPAAGHRARQRGDSSWNHPPAQHHPRVGDQHRFQLESPRHPARLPRQHAANRHHARNTSNGGKDMAGRKPKGLGGGLALLNKTAPSPSSTTEQTEPLEPAGKAAAGEQGSDSNWNHSEPVNGTAPSRARTGGIIDALRREDTAGKVVMRLPLDDVLEHIENPREALGDLTGLAASLKDLGQLQPAVVVSRDDFLAARPGWPAVAKPWVLVAGHRRRAALELAGIDYIDAVQMPGGDKVNDHLTMYAENVHRAGLAALEEAQLFNLLVDDGLSQRAIATRLGISQSHVSKRLSLLKLPQEVQDAITREQVSVADALALTGVPEDEQWNVWLEAQRERIPIASVVARIERERSRQAAVTKARKAAEKAGVPIVEDPREEWGSGATSRRLYSDEEIETAKAAGELYAHPTGNGLAYYSANADKAPVSTSSNDAQDKKARDAARKARTAAAATLAAKRPTPQEAAEAAIDHVLFNGGLYAESLKLAHKWLGEKVGERTDSPHAWRDSLAGADIAARRWVAWAMALAYAELHARDVNSPWGPAQRTYLNHLFIAVGYQPTPWEQARLDAIPATSADTETDTGAETSTDASKETDQ